MTLAIIAGFLAALARTGAFLQAAPLVGEHFLDVRLRLMLATMLALAVASVRGPLAPMTLPLVLPAELLIGALTGFAARVVVGGAETAGQLIGMQVGLGFSSSFDPALGESAIAARRLAWCFGTMAFLSAGGLESAVPILTRATVTQRTLSIAVPELIHQGGVMFVAAVRFAAPVILTGLVVNIVMALASRAAPALNVFSVMLAGVLLVGGAVLITTAPAFVRELAALGRRAIEASAGVAGL